MAREEGEGVREATRKKEGEERRGRETCTEETNDDYHMYEGTTRILLHAWISLAGLILLAA